MVKSLVTTAVLFVWLRFGLEPTAWFFYEVSHFTGIQWLYWGYSVFRGVGYYFGVWAYQTIACVIAAVATGGLVYYFGRRGSVA